MKNLSMSQKLGLGFGTVTLLMCLQGYMAYTALVQSAENTAKINNTYIPAADAATGILDQVRMVRFHIREFEVTGKPADYAAVQRYLGDMPDNFGRLQTLSEQNSDLAVLGATVREYPPLFKGFLEGCAATARQAEAVQKLVQVLGASAEKAEKALAELSEIINSAHQKFYDESNVESLSRNGESMRLRGLADVQLKETRRLYALARLTYDESVRGRVAELGQTALQTLQLLEASVVLDEAKARCVTASGALRDYLRDMDTLVTGWAAMNQASVQRREIAEKLVSLLERQKNAANANADKYATMSTEATQQALHRVVTVFCVAVVLSLLLALLITRSVTKPLARSMKFAQAIAEGDLNATLDIEQRDEVGRLADALRAVPQVLREVTAEYAAIEQHIASGRLDARGDADKFHGEFGNLIRGTNAVLQRFQTLLEYIPSSVVMLDGNLKAAYLNATARQLVGDNYRGKTCGELFQRDDYESATDGLRIAVRSGRPANGETTARPGGKRMDVAYTVVPMLNGQGQLNSVMQFINDVSEIKDAQRTILHVADEAVGISGRVASAAEQLSAQVEEAGRGAAITAERIGETATAMEEMNATVLEVARSAGGAAGISSEARTKAEQGADTVASVVKRIADVERQASQLKDDMGHLGQQAEAIGAIMNVISDIADQTNLLALNAAIEAARAGEAGRGFAVVADEVRKLAEKTMHATVQVGDAIKGVQRSADQNMRSVDISSQSIAEATGLARQAGDALKEIVDLVENSADQVRTIATAAEQQSSTSEEINHSLGAINGASSEAARAMGEASQAVAELSQQAQALARLIDDMKR